MLPWQFGNRVEVPPSLLVMGMYSIVRISSTVQYEDACGDSTEFCPTDVQRRVSVQSK